MSAEKPLGDDELVRIERRLSDECSWDDAKRLLVEVIRLRTENAEWRVLADGRLDDARKAIAKYDRLRARNSKLVEAMQHAMAYSSLFGQQVLRAAIEENDDGK